MKKTVLIFLVCLFVMATLSAARTRAYTQAVSDPNSVLPLLQFPDVTNTSSSTAAGYVVRAWVTTRPTEVTATTTHAASVIRLFRFGNGTTVPYNTRVFLQFANWATDWTVGETVRVEITNNNVTPSMTDHWDLVIPDNATSALTITTQIPMELWPAGPSTYDVTVNSTPSGQPIYNAMVATGFNTPHTFTFDAGTDHYFTVVNDAYTWDPAFYQITDLAENTTINFAGTFIPIVVTPNPAINPTPANGATIQRAWDAGNAAVTLMWEPDLAGPAPVGYWLVWNGAAAADLGNVTQWETPAIGAGVYGWQVIPYANDITSPGRKVAINNNLSSRVAVNSASRNGGVSVSRDNKDSVKGNAVNCPVWGFTVAYDPAPVYYEFEVTSEPVGATIWVNGVVTAFVTPYTFSMLEGTSALYAVSMNGYDSWAPADYQVTNIMQAGNVNFVGTATPTWDIPAGEPTVVSGVTIVSDINLNYDEPSPAQNDVIVALPNFANITNSVVTVLSGSGVGSFSIAVGVGNWYGIAYYNGSWHQALPFNINPGPGVFVFSNIDFGAKGDVIILLSEDDDPTLPVELSRFAAVLTAQNFVALNWTSESETEMLGYRVYRAEMNDVNSAIMITPTIIAATNTSTTQNYKYEDREVSLNTTYWYWLESVDYGTSHMHGPVSVTVTGNVVPELPTVTTMGNIYPNPFRMGANANLEVSVKAGDNATVTVYNILGQAVKTFSVNEGAHTITWNGKDSKGNLCGSGIYFYKLSSNTMNQTKKMVIIK